MTTVVVTGATGFLGSQAVAALLADGVDRVVAPVRGHHPPGAVADAVAASVEAETLPAGWQDRITQTAMSSSGASVADLVGLADGHAVDEVVHCAGCLSYTDTDELEAVNVGFTTAVLRAAERWGADRFVHVSTAFAGGYPVPGASIPEALHAPEAPDPTPYTASKRRAEAVVTGGRVPWIVLRPSVVIGESATGHYRGPGYGLYQLWSGLERFLLDDWHEEIHIVAPDHPLPLLHQDAFRAGLRSARAHLDDGVICHLTSRPSPDVAAVAALAFGDHLRPRRAVFHDRLDGIDRAGLSRANRMLLRLAGVNLDIAAHDWRFETAALDALEHAGTTFIDASLASVRRCQDAFFTRSPRYRRYVEAFAERFPTETEIARA